MLYGIDNFLQRKREYAGLRLGMVTNDAATTIGLVPSRMAVQQAGLDLCGLFSPEHGLATAGADGKPMPDMRDGLTGLPVRSLYGATQQGMAVEWLDGYDALLFDLPDVGVRFYTYIWTLSQVMEACEKSGILLVVLDRPNPLSGNLNLCEGPMLDESRLSSFIGRWTMPIRHSLTIGELARFWKNTRCPGLNLVVVPVQNWQRSQYFQDLNLPFVPTSPGIPSVETILSYPTLCFLEGTNLSEGRGTAFPFRVGGSPWLDAAAFCGKPDLMSLKGVVFRPMSFLPKEGRCAEKICQGFMLHVTDRHFYRPILVGLTVVAALKKYYPRDFTWSTYPTAANPSGMRHLDLLTGQSAISAHIDANPEDFLAHIPDYLETGSWRESVADFLIY